LTVNGVACNRRVGKLYLPPGGRYFGCRACYDLAYRSSQRAHQLERTLAGVARLERRIAKLTASARQGKRAKAAFP